MRIVTEHERFNGSYAAVNAFSITGLNGHALFHGYRKQKDLSKYQSTIPYLVMASGRQESAVQKILDDISSRHLDPEEIALLHNIYKTRIMKHLARGFGIYSTANEKTVTHNLKVDYYDDAKQPLWFVYSGMGSQWVGMGTQLMTIPVFAASIARCHKVLEPKGIDLIGIITSEDKDIYKNILHSFVGISAIQIALTDVLTTIGLFPDKIIGHSLGELGCAYADGCLTTEEVMLLSYVRGLVSISTPLMHGSMAAIGLGYKQLSKICPPEIDIACHNNSTSSTISGPFEAVQKFVARLTAGGIFAKEVQCSNIAYHSRYIAKVGPEFNRLSKEVVSTPKLRSERWISSSVPFEKWNEPNAMYSSAAYHTNNLLNTVLFEEGLRFVPANAVLIEIAPHGLLQAVLKRALPSCTLVQLTRRGHSDQALFLLEGIGNLFMAGYDPDVSALYPKVEFPVSTSTRPLGHLVEWVHTEKWKQCRYLPPVRTFCSVFRQIVTVEDEDFQYLKGHRIEGTRVLPYAACLVAVWDTLAMTLGHARRQLSVQFQDVVFHSQPSLLDDDLMYLVATVQRGSGHFEVFDGNVVLIEGTIAMTSQKAIPVTHAPDKEISKYLSREDIYKLLYERGYEYKDSFRAIHSMDASMKQGLIEWQDNWVAFIDSILQMNVLFRKHHWVSEPKAMKRMVIDVRQNMNEKFSRNGLLDITHDEVLCRTRCGGVTAEHIFFKNKTPLKKPLVALETLKFVPFNQTENIDTVTAICTLLQVVAENVNSNKIMVYFVTLPKKPDYVDKVKKIMETLPDVDLNIVRIKEEDILDHKKITGKADAVFMYDLLADKKMFETLYHAVPPDTFVISLGLEAKVPSSTFATSIYKQVATIGNGRFKVELARFRPIPSPCSTTAITIRTMSDMHQLKTTCEMLSPQHKLLVLAPHPAPSGLKDQVKLWRKNCHKNVSMVMFDQRNSMDNELENIPDMAVSILQEGVWGGEYYVPTKIDNAPVNGPFSLTCTRPGDLSSLNWIGVEEPTSNGVEVTVHYAGLVGSDASRALAEQSAHSPEGGFGMDFSGVTASRERVMGLLPRGSASSKVRADLRMLWPVPAHWTLEDAATVPFAYCYALYILSRKCNPAPGMSILVQGGAGALGQALISVALGYGLEVFATVSDMRKKHFLKKLFPELKDDHIGNSRDDSFKDMVRSRKGADVVINCAKGELKSTAIQCCAPFGVVIDTAHLVTRENFVLGMKALWTQSYLTIDFSSVLTMDNDMELRKLQLMLSEGIIRGYVRPLSRVTYAPHETPRAFRLLAGSRHRGRVLLSLQEKARTLPKISCEPSKSYVVVYEDESFGLQLAELLIKRGARNLQLHGRHTSYLTHKIRGWKELGVQVGVSSANLLKKGEALSLFGHANNLGPVAGVYVVATNQKQKPEMTETILSYLDTSSRKACPELRHFAIISENDRVWRAIISERARDGYPALSMELPNLEKFDPSGVVHNEEKSGVTLSVYAAIEVIEKALFSGDHLITAFTQEPPTPSIMEEVAKIPGVNITNATVDRTKLEQVGVDQGRALELSNLLQLQFGITVAPASVPKMTIGQLKQLKKETLKGESDIEGFGAYINTIDDDEMRATSDLVLMPTLVHRSEMRYDEMDLTQDCLCIIPGLEGHHQRFRSLCERLKVPAIVLQHGHNHLNDTLQEAAQRLADTIIKYLRPKQTFYLLGYEFGVLLSLEVAAILESYGLTGTVYMLGGTPEDIRSSFNDCWKDEDTMQNALIHHIYTTISKSTSPELDEVLKATNSWNQKISALIKTLRRKVSHSSQYIEGITNGIYSRVKLLQNYDILPHKLKSKIVLVQAKPFKSSPRSLKPFTDQEPVVKNLNSNLAFADKDLTCPNIINAHLSWSILEHFNVSNQCDTGLVNHEEYAKLLE